MTAAPSGPSALAAAFVTRCVDCGWRMHFFGLDGFARCKCPGTTWTVTEDEVRVRMETP